MACKDEDKPSHLTPLFLDCLPMDATKGGWRRVPTAPTASVGAAVWHLSSPASSKGDTATRRPSELKRGPTTIEELQLMAHSPLSVRALGDDAAVFPDVITEEEERVLIGDLETVFRRKRYENGHFGTR